jgi:hypothetical protein
MAVLYSVTRMPLGEAREDLHRIWSSSLQGIGNVDERLEWYAQAPTPSNHVYMLAAEGGVHPRRIVGAAGVEIRAFALAGRELRAGLGCNLAVEAAHRTVLPGLRLLREVRRATSGELDLAYNVPNARAQPLFLRAGYRELGQMSRYVRILRHAPYVSRVVGIGAAARAAGAALDLATMTYYSRRHCPKGFELVWIDQPDERFDALWERVKGEYRIVGRRDARWLRWRCFVLPTSRARIAALVERGGAGVRAYALVDTRDGVAHIRDLFGPIADLDVLLIPLARDLRRAGIVSMSFAYLGSAAMDSLLAAHGFFARPTDRRIFVDAGPRLTEQERALVMDPQAWHLTEYDEDS